MEYKGEYIIRTGHVFLMGIQPTTVCSALIFAAKFKDIRITLINNLFEVNTIYVTKTFFANMKTKNEDKMHSNHTPNQGHCFCNI